jgi:DNA polymerase-3 subunit delta'
MSRAPQKTIAPESDVFPGAPHPRETIDLFGHDPAEQALLEAYRSGRMPQSIIVGGQEGVGKATLAWRLARFVFAHPDPASPEVQSATSLAVPADHPVSSRIASLAQPDLAVLRRQWNEKTKKHFTEIRVDDIRRSLNMFQFSSGAGGWRICIIDCAEDMNRNGANAILKIIEEPPPRSLFLIVSHKPAQMLPTIRSRSRLIQLKPLTPEDVSRAVTAMGGPWKEFGGEIAFAAGRSNGSVRHALRMLDSERLALAEKLDKILAGLPKVDWVSVHSLADTVSKVAAIDEFETFYTGVFDWLDATVRQRAERGAANLAPLAQVWEKLTFAVRETEALNLDKRALILTMFADLSLATQAARL